MAIWNIICIFAKHFDALTINKNKVNREEEKL